jgi:hypothetical protein
MLHFANKRIINLFINELLLFSTSLVALLIERYSGVYIAAVINEFLSHLEVKKNGT